MNEIYNRWLIAISDYTLWASEGAWWGGIGFLTGFLLKNTGKYIVSAILTVAISLIILQHVGIAIVHIDQLLAALGLSSLHTVNDVQTVVTSIIHNHIVGVLGASFGFLAGWKIG